jgi:c-di-AMP phosphodiesterase-like protein
MFKDLLRYFILPLIYFFIVIAIIATGPEKYQIYILIASIVIPLIFILKSKLK